MAWRLRKLQNDHEKLGGLLPHISIRMLFLRYQSNELCGRGTKRFTTGLNAKLSGKYVKKLLCSGWVSSSCVLLAKGEFPMPELCPDTVYRSPGNQTGQTAGASLP